MQSLLEEKRGLTVVPKPTMLSLVPEGRLFRATTMASCGGKKGREVRVCDYIWKLTP